MLFLICLKGLAELHREFKVRLGCVVGFTDSRKRNYTANVGVFKHCDTGEGPMGDEDTGDSGEEEEDDADTPVIMVLVSNTLFCVLKMCISSWNGKHQSH